MVEAIIILVNKSPPEFPEDFEYRVSYVPSFDRLFNGLNETTGQWRPNTDYILDQFMEKDIYTNIDDAFAYADALMAEVRGELEYGICLVKDFEDICFVDL